MNLVNGSEKWLVPLEGKRYFHSHTTLCHYVIKCASNMRFLLFPPTNKPNINDITEILLKVALNQI